MSRIFALACIALMLTACASSNSSRNASRDRALDDNRREDAAETNVQLAGGYYEQGRVELALQKVTRALELDPNSAEAHSVAGIVYERIDDDVAAEKHYRRAAQLDRESGQIHNNYGQFLCKEGRYGRGIEHLELAMKDPFYATPAVALTNIGACRERAGELSLAEASYRQALEANARYPDALYRMARLLIGRDEAFRARAFLQRFEEVSQPSPDALALGIRIETALGNAEGAAMYDERRKRLFGDTPTSAAVQSTDRTTP